MPPEPRILLDECVPTDLYREFPPQLTVDTVQYAGFKGLKNGLLLQAARDRYDVILTLDCGFQEHQNISASGLALITLVIDGSSLPVLRSWIGAIVSVAKSVAPGQSVVIHSERGRGEDVSTG